MESSYSFAENQAAQTPYHWLIASLFLSLVLHGLIFFLHSGVPSLPTPARPATNHLDLRLVQARQSNRSQPSVSEAVVPTISVPSQMRDHHASRKTDRRPTSRNTSPTGVADTPRDVGSSDSSPSIDLDAAREIARQTARLPHNPTARTEQNAPESTEQETVLGRKISRSAHPDCRTSYAGAGLFAIPLLLIDATREGGCKW